MFREPWVFVWARAAPADPEAPPVPEEGSAPADPEAPVPPLGSIWFDSCDGLEAQAPLGARGETTSGFTFVFGGGIRSRHGKPLGNAVEQLEPKCLRTEVRHARDQPRAQRDPETSRPTPGPEKEQHRRDGQQEDGAKRMVARVRFG